MSRMLQALKGIQARMPDGMSPPDEITSEELGTLGLAWPLEPWNAVRPVAADSVAPPRESAACPGQPPKADNPRRRTPEPVADSLYIVGSMVDTGPDWTADPMAADALAGFDPVVIDDAALAASWPDIEPPVFAAAGSFTAESVETIDRAGDDCCKTVPLPGNSMELDEGIESAPEHEAARVATEGLTEPPDKPSASFFVELPADSPEASLRMASIREDSTPDRSANDEPPSHDDRDLAYWHLAENVLSQVPHAGSAALMFTSPAAGSRKTIVVARLAMMLARRLPGEVVAIDADWQGTGLGRHFGFGASRGLVDILSGRASWRDVLRTADGTRLNIIPRGDVKRRSEPEIDGNHLPSLLDSLRRHARLVLVNAPATAAYGIHPLAALCEAVYLVVRLGHTPGRATRHAVALLAESGIPLCGCVLTGA
ncbi:MAG: CpsD/CapB family tyrosine-protein kinase [Thermoguttaceae bacterium]|nr:CpsD/CapB family tyrosine-protein kinase [Thermoguttaceae bacterium]